MHARQAIAAARGIQPGGGCLCLCCGQSPYDVSSYTLGQLFSDYDALLNPDAAAICTGCAALLGGKPSKTNPPLRMTSILVTDAQLQIIDRAGMWAALESPPDRCIISWATSKKRHHWLHAAWSDSAHMVVGSDDGPVIYTPATDRPVLDAVRDLRRGHNGKPIIRSESIRLGSYSPAAVNRYGIARWAELETVITPYRGRRLLDLLCWCAPAGLPIVEEQTNMIDRLDQDAAELLAILIDASRLRREDGLSFWGGVFRHRLARVRRLKLPDMVSRLIDQLAIAPAVKSTRAAVAMVAALTEDEQAAIERSIRERAALLVAMAFDVRQRDKQRLEHMGDQLCA